MIRKFILLFIIQIFFVTTALAALGDWKAYMAYSEVQEIEQVGNLIFVQASNGLYVYNKNDQSIQTFSKVDYLNDCEIKQIAYNKTAKRLCIIYTNGNIDFMNPANYEVENLSDYYSFTTTNDKTVNDIYMVGKFAYMSTGFGITKVNVSDREISDTYDLGFNVNWCEIKNNYIYAYSQAKGQYRAPLTANLLDKSNWTKVDGYIAKQTEDKSELKQIVSTLSPGGPKYNHFWYLKYAYNQLYTSGGAFLSGVVGKNYPGTIQVLSGDDWTIYQDQLDSITGYEYQDINRVEPDINNPNHVFASGRTGVYEFLNGRLQTYYNKDNSVFEGAVSNNTELGNNYVLVHSILCDSKGSFWFLNSQAKNNSIIELNSNREFVKHPHSQLMETSYSLPCMVGLMKDSRNLMWFVNNNSGSPCVVCYQPETDGMNVWKGAFINQDLSQLTINYIRCIKEDADNNIWIGTDNGPFYIGSSDITNSSSTLTQVKVPRNDGTNYADYLLSGVDITCMAIDKANRKWFGTSSNGIYLISSDNIEQLHNFTVNNSPLLSNSIESIAINDKTGEVFIATDKGLCSYMSDASEPADVMNKDDVWAYPNPVKPDYTGLITVVGLSMNADVKVVTSNGALVAQGRSNGGTFTWDGCDQNGKRVASGIYMVEAATSDGGKGVVCKIAIVR